MIQDAVWAGLLPKHLLETRLAAVIETDLGALDDEDQATAKLYVQKAAQAADEAWQQTVGGLQGPSVADPTIASLEHPSSVSQDEDSDDVDFSAPQLQAQLSRLTDQTRLKRLKSTLFSKEAWQQVARMRRLVPHACLPQVALSL